MLEPSVVSGLIFSLIAILVWRRLEGLGSRLSSSLRLRKRGVVSIAVLVSVAVGLGVAWTANAAPPEEKPTLPTSPLRYGSLMADLWLSVDVAQQAERGLLYSREAEGDKPRTEWLELQQSLTAA